MNDIEWTKKAAKQLRKIDRKAQRTIYTAIESLAHFPGCGNVRQLVNHQYPYRLRVGRYRVFSNAQTEIRIFRIEEVKKRDERTY
jgi:mRNA-degrading endonuclease RelE of RelBE toxin-antitoxin system